LKMVKISMVLAVMASIITIPLSSPSEGDLLQGDGSIPGAGSEMFLEPLPDDGGGARPHSGPGSVADGDDQPPGGPFRAEGVALERGETYFLHIWLIDTKRIPPSLARDMLRENRSLDEIREEISVSEGTNTTRGGMVLGENRFILVEINQTVEENCTIFDADLVRFEEIQMGAFNRTAGHITVRTCEENGVQVGLGNLTLTDDEGVDTSYKLTFLPSQLEHITPGNGGQTLRSQEANHAPG